MTSIGIARPAWASLGLFATVIGGAYAAASTLAFEHGIVSATLQVAAPRVIDVAAGQAAVDRVLVVEGQRVSAGEVIAQIDSTEIDREVATLKEKSTAVQRQLDAVRAETQSFAILHDQQLVSRSKVAEIEARLVELQSNARELIEQIRSAEDRLARAIVRAPVTGTVRAVNQHPDEPYKPGEPILQISPDPDRIVLEGRLPPNVVSALRASSEARAWTGPVSLIRREPLRVRLTWLAHDAETGATPRVETSDAMVDRPTLGLMEVEQPRSALHDPQSLQPGTVVSIHVRDRHATLLDQISRSWPRTVRRPAAHIVYGE